MLIDGPGLLVSLSDKQRDRLRKLAWDTVSKLVVATAGAVGTKLGEKLVEWALDDEEPDDSDDDEDDGDEET